MNWYDERLFKKKDKKPRFFFFETFIVDWDGWLEKKWGKLKEWLKKEVLK